MTLSQIRRRVDALNLVYTNNPKALSGWYGLAPMSSTRGSTGA